MTLEQLVNVKPEEAEALMKDGARLEKYFAPFFNITRPDEAKIKSTPLKKGGNTVMASKKNKDFSKLQQKARELGIDLGL